MEVLAIIGVLRRSMRRQRVFRDLDSPFERYDDHTFRSLYRFSKPSVFEIVNLLEEDLRRSTNRNASLHPEQQVFIALRFYATNNFQKELADIHGRHQTTVSRIVSQVSFSLAKLRPNFVRFPSSNNDGDQTMTIFKEIANFPGVIGVVDGTHIRIQSQPGMEGGLYINRKGWPSINVQIICGPKLEIFDIVARWYGSAHDSRIFRESRVNARFEEGELSGLLLGDSGYPCLPYLMVPFLCPANQEQRAYNTALRRTRMKVECSIGVLKRRFPCLHFGMRLKRRTLLSVIVACAVLHNIAIKWHEDDSFDSLPDDDDCSIANVESNSSQDSSGVEKRLQIAANQFCTP